MSGQTAYYWREMQAGTRAVMDSLRKGDILSMEYHAYGMLEKMYRLLAQLNDCTYSGFATFSAEIKRLKTLPTGFKELAEQIMRGQLYATSDLRRRLAIVTKSFDELYEG